jgi:hypothetical protein
VLAFAGALLLGAGCGESGDRATETNSPAPRNESTAVIPVAGGQPTSPAPQFMAQVPSIPTGGVTLEELHSQGKADVLR